MTYNFDELDDIHLSRDDVIILCKIWSGIIMVFATYNYFLN